MSTTTTKGTKLDTAVILTSGGIFGWGGVSQETSVGPMTRVGGVPLFMRALLTLQRARFTNVMVLCGEEMATMRAGLRDDQRITMALRWLPVREFPPDDPRTWQALGVEVQGACLVLGARAVFGPGLLERLREEMVEGQMALVIRRPTMPECRSDGPYEGFNPLAEHRANRLVALHDWTGNVLPPSDRADQWCVATDMVVVPATLLAATGLPASPRKRVRLSGAGARATGHGASPDVSQTPSGRLLRPVSSAVYPIRALLERAAGDGLVRVLATSPGTQHWYREVHRPADHKAAERTLLQSLKGDLEGFVDRYFNRKVSGALTRVFLKFGLSANAVTALSLVIGLLSGVSFAMGGYAAGIIGALLFQLSAIVDCCDGEIARLTFTESSSGELFDLIADNVVHYAIFAGITWALATREPGVWNWVPVGVGTAVIIGNLFSLWLVLRARHLRKTQGWSNPTQAHWGNFILQHVASRDFSVLVLFLALINHLDWFLWLTAIGSNVFWIVMAWMTRTRPSLQPRHG